MMNYIFTFAILFSVITALFCNNITTLPSGILEGASDAVDIAMRLLATLSLWNGISEIAEESGLLKKAQRLLSPLLRLLFPKYAKTSAAAPISANITANFMGLGNGATPLGIEAMRRMKELSGETKADNEMVRFVVLNSASLTLIPATAAALRAAAGSREPFSIIIPVWLTGICALTAGLIAEKLLSKGWKK